MRFGTQAVGREGEGRTGAAGELDLVEERTGGLVMEIDLGQSASYEQSSTALAPTQREDGLEDQNLQH